ncbi:dermonecrotic toxin domain-containing protein [Pseudomonas sp. UFMG81]|uniref:dermonecrotic toxin domain-containing protein n=1 Tax=Pseudomonas sp. UFMG81 TaxID=2745936 RepID=UPI001890A0C0|nr:DUF6543 domain-containing protein [Pseudomonas sp. UFMG81]
MSTEIVGPASDQFIRELLGRMPRPDHAANDAIRAWATRNGQDLDPQRTLAVTLHYTYAQGQGWLAKVADSRSMGQALLENWQPEALSLAPAANLAFAGSTGLIDMLGLRPWQFRHAQATFPKALSDNQFRLVEELPLAGSFADIDDHNVFYGLFRQSEPQRYDASTLVPLDATLFQQFIWDLDFHDVFKGMLDTFWNQSLDDYASSCRIGFLAACNRQRLNGSLSDAGRRLAWRAAGIEQPGPAGGLAANGIEARMLNVYGYVASDILCLRDRHSGLALLYIPGNANPIHEFASHEQLREWLASQCRDSSLRASLLAHFKLQDLPDGLTYHGLAVALKGLGRYPDNLPPTVLGGVPITREQWPPQIYVNYQADTYSPHVGDDPFLAMALAMRQRSLADADFLITRDSDVGKARWRGYLYQVINLLAPLTLLAPELIPLLAVGGAAQFALGLDQAINDKALGDRVGGLLQAGFGLLNAAPGTYALGSRGATLLRSLRPGFIRPMPVNGRLGYPLSPMNAPHWPEPAVAGFFHLPEPILALPDAPAETAETVLRTPQFNGHEDRLQACIGDYSRDLSYDLHADAFVLNPPAEQGAVRYIAQSGPVPSSPLRGSPRRLVIAQAPDRIVSMATRTSTLRALGVDLELPVRFETGADTLASPIPKVIFGVWVGDKPIDAPLLANMASNGQKLKGSLYNFRLYLSRSNSEAFSENLAALATHVPDLEVLELEAQPAFQRFAQSRYFAQYRAALYGNGGEACNFSSASDILRYRLLHEHGGLYMDLDDRLLALGESGMGASGEAIDSVPLQTTADGLLLHPPLSNEMLNMNTQFNTSMIGSHAGNPTLDAISELMLERYTQAPDFYLSKPSLATDRAAFFAYANQLNTLTGPKLLTDVVDQRLPMLRLLRQVANLEALPRINAEMYVDFPHYQALCRKLLPLNRIASVGANHSWMHT